jgi:hypothetical protein
MKSSPFGGEEVAQFMNENGASKKEYDHKRGPGPIEYNAKKIFHYGF